MRIAALVFALLGAAGSGFVGFAFNEAEKKAQAEGRPVDPARAAHLQRAKYALVAGVPLCVVGGFLALNRKGKLAALVLAAAYAAPVAILAAGIGLDLSDDGAKIILLAPAGLVVAALLALFVRPRVAYRKPRPLPDLSRDDDLVG